MYENRISLRSTKGCRGERTNVSRRESDPSLSVREVELEAARPVLKAICEEVFASGVLSWDLKIEEKSVRKGACVERRVGEEQTHSRLGVDELH